MTISVPVLGDTLREPNETFTVELSGAVNATLADDIGLGTIIDARRWHWSRHEGSASWDELHGPVEPTNDLWLRLRIDRAEWLRHAIASGMWNW